ncbi:uncharacterized protein LOC125050175 [Pieris napi]|uniref:uncharacterized protein LOC125050175 n=1 Tax=Pieris napi TaxID=78633 RepID=UPI001FB8AA57|nr:uncharacterized protein LOC125050175 [Pieris napi]XP_047505776.1 uncharacterized protein LOC125050175 [Pieris napi]
MKKFAFQSSSDSHFSGSMFFEIYKNADFLCHNKNVETILSKGYQLRQALKDISPGEKVTMQDMWLTSVKDIPLLVIKGGPNVIVKHYEFTANRLTGLTAAYANDNRSQFPQLQATEAQALGLKWDNKCPVVSKLYLASVSGTEHFYEQFSFWPLVCALKKLQLKKITLDPVVKMAKIKNRDGIRLCQDMMGHWEATCSLWSQFTEATTDFKKTFKTFPRELKQLFP